jgi:phosphatidylethanolamine/phosphatidyl-N-methylethanolamine N-methyltransferase
MQQTREIRLKEGEFFFRRWLSSPKSMGSIWPSSQALARALAELTVAGPGEFVVELGGGTGAITKGLLAHGFPRDRLAVIELDSDLADFLERRLPGCRVVCGDATRLKDLLASNGIEGVGTVISGLPMVGMPFAFQKAIVGQALSVVRPGGRLLQYSYSPVPPIRTGALGVRAELARYVVWNLPPASIWRISRRT